MTGHFGEYWQQQPPFPPPGVPTGYPPPRKSRWPWIIGAIVVAIAVVVVAVLAVIGYMVTGSTEHTASTVTVTYEVTGTGKAEVRYKDPNDLLSPRSTVDLPWRTQVTMPTTVMPFVSANQASAGLQMACRISSGDNVIYERKSAIGLVYCSGDPDKY